MRTQVGKWGNSLAIRLPRDVAIAAGIREGAPIELEVKNGVIHLSAARPRYTLAELLAGMTPENQHESFDDRAHGEEAL